MTLDTVPRWLARNRTRFVGLGLALAVVASVAGAIAAGAGAVAIDDMRPCPAAYTEPVGEEPLPQPPFVCPGGIVGSPYAVQLLGRGSCEPYFRFAVVTGALPPGLSISSSGLIGGTPTTAGSWTFRVRVQDLGAAEGGPAWCTSSDQTEGEFTIAVDPGLVITTDAAAPGTIGALYNLPLSAQVVSAPTRRSPLPGCEDGSDTEFCSLTWSVAQGQLPARFTLNPISGLIWGTPTAEGSASFVVRVALDDGREATKRLTITVRRHLSIRAQKPFAPTGAPTLWEVGVPFAAKLRASGGTGTFSWSLTAGALPAGLALAADGRMIGTPRAAGEFRATIHAADREGRAADYPAVFRIASRIAISTRKLGPGKLGFPYRAKLAATGGVGPRTWTLESGSLPHGIRFDRARGMLIGAPVREGRYRVRIKVTDALGATSTRSLVLDVFG